MRLVNWRSLAIAAAGFGLAACGDDVTVTPTPITFTTNPSSVSCVAGGGPTAVGLSVQGGTGTPTVTFQASGSGFTVTQNGNSATINCTAAGAGAVNFTITSGGQTVNGSIPVTVSAAQSAVTAVTIDPTSATLVPGGQRQFVATVTLAQGAPAGTLTTVTWASSDTTVATVNTTGLVTARGTAAGRSAVITATSTANTNLRASAAVTVGPASSLVSGLAVSPSAVNLSTGGTQQITSSVTLAAGAPAGTSTGVTFTSSDTSIAKVSSTGLVTAGSRAGVATITVASVAAPTVTQTIGVNVTSPAPVRLTIQSLTVTNAAGNQVSADPTNVAGRLVATLNLDPGDFRPDSVVVTLGGARTNCQTFSAQLVEAYRRALTDGSADVAPVQCIVNTAAFDTLTGAASVQNGQRQLNATVFYRPQGGGASTTQTATITQNLTLNNQSGFFVQVTNTPTAAQAAINAAGQATGPQGVLWRAGSITVTALPVFFTQPQGQTGTQTLNVSLNDATSGQIAIKQVSAAPNTTFNVTFGGATAAYTPTPANQALNGYTSPGAGVANGGTTIQIGGAANTVFLNSNGVPQAGGPVIWVDNAYPEPRTQFVSQNFISAGSPVLGFLNGAFVFSDSVQQAAAATTLGDNNGVDRVTRSFFYLTNNIAGTTAASIVAANQPATSANGTIAIPANTNAGAFVAAANLADALGNAVPVFVTATNTGVPFQFGVSTAAPTAAFAGASSIGSNARLGATAGAGQTIQVSVTSPVGFAAATLVGTLQVVTPTGTFCATTADVAGNVLTGVSTTGTNPPCPQLSFSSVTIDPTTAMQGVYTLSVQSRDVAGNTSAALTRSFVVDRVPPVVVNAAPGTPILSGGQPATFTAQATDNLSLVDQLALVNYQTPGQDLNLRYTGTPLSTSALATPFTASANLSVTIPSLVRAINLASNGGPVTNYQTNTFVGINGVAIGAIDAGNNGSYAGLTGANLLLNQNQTAPTFFGLANGLQNISIAYTPNTTTTPAAAPVNLFASSANGPQSLTITFTQNGPANQPFTSPFQKIEVYQRAAVPAGGALPFTNTNAYQLVGTFSTGGLVVTPTTSRITSTFTVTPGSNGITAFPSSNTRNLDLLIVASDAAGFAVATIVPTIVLAP